MKTRCGQGWLLLQALRESAFQATLHFGWSLAILPVLRPVGGITPISASVFLCLCALSYKDTSHWIQGPPYIQYDIVLRS